VLSERGLAQESDKTGDTPGENQDASDEIRLSQVVIDGETLFSVRGVTAFPAENRAEEIVDRIQALAMDPKIDASSLALQEHPGSIWILANGGRIMLDGAQVKPAFQRANLCDQHAEQFAASNHLTFPPSGAPARHESKR
jgi:hypothetical protein